MTSTLTVGSTVKGTCRCHRGLISGQVESQEIVKLAGRPVRLLYVRTGSHLHAIPAGNAR